MSLQSGLNATADSISTSLQSLSLQSELPVQIANPVGRPHSFGAVQRVSVDGRQHAYNTLRWTKPGNQQEMTKFMNKETVRFFAKFGWENPERDVPPGVAEPDQDTISVYEASAKEASRAVKRGCPDEEQKRRDELVRHVRTIMLARFQTNFPDSKRKAKAVKERGADISKLLLKYWEKPSMKQLYKVWANSKPRPDLDAEIDRLLPAVREQKGDPEYKRIGVWNTVAADWYRSASEEEKEQTMEKAKDILAKETKKWKEDLAAPKTLEDAIKFMSASKDFLEDLMEFFADHCGGMAVMILAGAGKVMVSEGVCNIAGKPKVKYSELGEERHVIHAVSERIHTQACLVTETKWDLRLSDYRNEPVTREGTGEAHSPEALTTPPAMMSNDNTTAVQEASTQRRANADNADQLPKDTFVSHSALDISLSLDLPVDVFGTNTSQTQSSLEGREQAREVAQWGEDDRRHEEPIMDVCGAGELGGEDTRVEKPLPKEKAKPKPRPTARRQASAKSAIAQTSRFDDAGALTNVRSIGEKSTDDTREPLKMALPAPPCSPPDSGSLRSDQLHGTRGNGDVLSSPDHHDNGRSDGDDGVGDSMHIKIFGADYDPCGQCAPETNQRGDLSAVLRQLVDDLVRDEADETSHFGSRGRFASWSNYILEIPERYESSGWSVSRAVLKNVLEKYLNFELAKSPPASTSCHGWSAFELHGERIGIRPVYLSKLQGPHYTAAWPDLGQRNSSTRDAKLADWNIGAALCEQWRLLQPVERLKGHFIRAAPCANMDWGEAVLGGKRGARLFILGLMIWADNLKGIQDGTTAHDWETLASDMALVFDVRTRQVRASTAAETSRPSDAEVPGNLVKGIAGELVAGGMGRESGGRPKRTVGGRADIKFAERYDALVEQQKRGTGKKQKGEAAPEKPRARNDSTQAPKKSGRRT
ncbi:unnamed protein product [Peniophora sp. CBMAI 1063]|nr:unnamed protein product [Peniophora sp. CBMAI 1063]